MAMEAGTKGRSRKEGERGGGGIRQGGIFKIHGGGRGGRGAGYNTVLRIVNIKAKRGVPKQALVVRGQEVGVGMHALVDAESHSKVWDVQPVSFPDNVPAKLEADHTNAKDWDIGTIGHVDESVRERLQGFKVIAMSSHAKETARINTAEVLVGG